MREAEEAEEYRTGERGGEPARRSPEESIEGAGQGRQEGQVGKDDRAQRDAEKPEPDAVELGREAR
jgi:hypothetical protein